MTVRDELQAAEAELENAYRLFNWSKEPRLIDEAIHRIRIAELRLDYLTHPGSLDAPAYPTLPWMAEGGTQEQD